MLGDLFTHVIVQPIFNVLVAIYALLPGHDFGLAIIIFTILVRLCMWPLVKRQLHQTKVMRKLQPELKRIKTEVKGDRKREGELVMELYKERGINPFATIPTLIFQFIILFGLYLGLRKLVDDPRAIVDNAYPLIRDLSWIQTLAGNISEFSRHLFGVVDLARPAYASGVLYWPALLLVIGSAAAQYFQSIQLLPPVEKGRTMRSVMREAAQGKQADQAEVSAIVAQSTRFLIPGMIFLFTLGLPSALSLYWFVGAIVAYIQQAKILNQDEQELEAIADKGDKAVLEGEIVVSRDTKTAPSTVKKSAKAKTTAKKKRRK